MSWIVTGLGTNLTVPIERTVVNLLQTNWNTTVPLTSDVKFNTDWYDENSDFMVSVNYLITTNNFKAIGFPSYQEYETKVSVHIFVRMLSEDESFNQLVNMEQEVDRILNLQGNALGTGLQIASITDWRDIPDPENVRTLWHRVATVSVKYWKTKV